MIVKSGEKVQLVPDYKPTTLLFTLVSGHYEGELTCNTSPDVWTVFQTNFNSLTVGTIMPHDSNAVATTATLPVTVNNAPVEVIVDEGNIAIQFNAKSKLKSNVHGSFYENGLTIEIAVKFNVQYTGEVVKKQGYALHKLGETQMQFKVRTTTEEQPVLPFMLVSPELLHFIGLLYSVDDDVMKVFIDGQEVASTNAKGPIMESNPALNIGAHTSTVGFVLHYLHVNRRAKTQHEMENPYPCKCCNRCWGYLIL